MTIEIKRVTDGPLHHFFGFHDLPITNAKGNLALALEVDDISHPVLAGQIVKSGVVNLQNLSVFQPIHTTTAFNYPQGARQQWIGDTDLFITNDKVDATWGARIADGMSLSVIDTLPFPVHCLNERTGQAFYVNYARLSRLGVYGYVGLPDKFSKVDIPINDGIYIGDINTKQFKLLVSIAQVAQCGEKKVVKTGYPHYVTHLCLNPSKTRIAFLHRYRIADGGEITRLLTVGTDGSDMRCLAKGFLSHFDWLDDCTLFIWGEDQRKLSRIREASIMTIPGVPYGLEFAKKMYKIARRKRNIDMKSSTSSAKSFLSIKDVPEANITKCAIGILTEDGHPMVSSFNRNYIINDTYPDTDGNRFLMLYNHITNVRSDLGVFRMLDEKPNPTNFDVGLALCDLDKKIKRKINLDDFFFTRSGLHCDLHPRWSKNGKVAFFDSIHEGSRQLYMIDLSSKL